ncbi:hypothetical protein Mpet_1878 [Methanolacinia petrolearia DSM 11571]|uniref:Uncharacterized protein n=1 Tax=Methanolacinia petrolearia (strain DSM 11571 / OCM 486 / SEBR 4847) TaxID=679926 RepID=E1RIN8_METP4|nr:hypothetical protein [Methanolacinia petrolearia]ADN36630.1 hypothetical protein Mpet_1878 [Methanolacinia petrolearia DSM 11571]
MDNVKKWIPILIITFFMGLLAGYFLPVQSDQGEEAVINTCPANVTDLTALNVALNDSRVIEFLENKSIDSIKFSGIGFDERYNYSIQIEFYLSDSEADTCLSSPRMFVKINNSCMIYSAYRPYPSYIPGCKS